MQKMVTRIKILYELDLSFSLFLQNSTSFLFVTSDYIVYCNENRVQLQCVLTYISVEDDGKLICGEQKKKFNRAGLKWEKVKSYELNYLIEGLLIAGSVIPHLYNCIVTNLLNIIYLYFGNFLHGLILNRTKSTIVQGLLSLGRTGQAPYGLLGHNRLVVSVLIQ